MNRWKEAHLGIIFICVIHWGILLIFGHSISPSGKWGVPALINYFICRWYIKEKITLNEITKDAFWWGVMTSLIVFTGQLIIGYLFDLIV